MPDDEGRAEGDAQDEPQGLDPEVEPDPAPGRHARPTPAHALLVFVGGATGVLARDGLLHLAPTTRDAIPWMLLALNVVGSALLGLLVTRVLDPRPDLVAPRLLLATGLLGGFTTYSSLVSAAIVQGHDGHLANGFVTLLATSVVGVAAAILGARTRTSAAPR
jgi:fluoride exporter